MYVPHVTQLAFGWSSLGARVNAVALVLVAPAIVVLGLRWGGEGAAVVYVSLNAAALLLVMGRMHRRLLPGELPRWYGQLLLPALAVAVLASLSRAGMPDDLSHLGRLGWLAATGALGTLGALGFAGGVRRHVLAAAQRLSSS
jgi:hypothetical protein